MQAFGVFNRKYIYIHGESVPSNRLVKCICHARIFLRHKILEKSWKNPGNTGKLNIRRWQCQAVRRYLAERFSATTLIVEP
jgi:hypothetical protein